MIKLMGKLAKDNSGATAVEYGLIVTLIVIAMIVSLQGVANQSSSMWTKISTRSQEAVDSVKN